jgi:hypothetical protein
MDVNEGTPGQAGFNQNRPFNENRPGFGQGFQGQSEFDQGPSGTTGVANQNPGQDQWRFVWHNGYWWYWTPANSWMVWNANQWTPYDQFVANWNQNFGQGGSPYQTAYGSYGRQFQGQPYSSGYGSYGYGSYDYGGSPGYGGYYGGWGSGYGPGYYSGYGWGWRPGMSRRGYGWRF